ncbi:hypothetical protein, partial [Cronobacter sakazakii]|uniref:hypothetical protein n=1 Tax=Cronobacter sakazakii TaxID=28141 RepID=UPI001F2EAE4F
RALVCRLRDSYDSASIERYASDSIVTLASLIVTLPRALVCRLRDSYDSASIERYASDSIVTLASLIV